MVQVAAALETRVAQDLNHTSCDSQKRSPPLQAAHIPLGTHRQSSRPRAQTTLGPGEVGPEEPSNGPGV